LSELIFSEFVELVVERNVRPEWPDDEDAPQLSDAIWGLADNCWAKIPKDRPTASAVCDILCHLLDTAVIAQATASPSSHLITQANPAHLLSAVIAQPTASPSSHLITQVSPPHPLSPAPNMTLRGHTGVLLSHPMENTLFQGLRTGQSGSGMCRQGILPWDLLKSTPKLFPVLLSLQMADKWLQVPVTIQFWCGMP
jgi:hypothetical protein